MSYSVRHDRSTGSISEETLASSQQCPYGSCILVGNSHRGDIDRPSTQQLVKPRATVACVCSVPSHYGLRTMHQQSAEIAIATLGNRSELRFPAGGLLSRNQAKPGDEVPSALERFHIADRRHHCRGGNRTDAEDLGQPLALLAVTMPLLNLALELRDPFL